MKCQEVDGRIIFAALAFWPNAAWATSCPVRAETFPLSISQHSHGLVNSDRINVASDCTKTWLVCVVFFLSFSYTTIFICGESPSTTRKSTTSCRPSSKVQVGNRVNLGSVTTATTPRSVREGKENPAFHHPWRIVWKLWLYLFINEKAPTSSNTSCDYINSKYCGWKKLSIFADNKEEITFFYL